MKLLLGCISTD